MSVKKDTKKPTRTDTGGESWTEEERAAMRERSQELAAERRRGTKAGKKDGEQDVLAALEKMSEPDRSMGRRIHEIVKASAPDLAPKTWYGMPAYAKDGKVVCFFQSADKFQARYATFGFNDTANLDKGAMWPTAFALTEMTPTEEKKIAALVKKAVN